MLKFSHYQPIVSINRICYFFILLLFIILLVTWFIALIYFDPIKLFWQKIVSLLNLFHVGLWFYFGKVVLFHKVKFKLLTLSSLTVLAAISLVNNLYYIDRYVVGQGDAPPFLLVLVINVLSSILSIFIWSGLVEKK